MQLTEEQYGIAMRELAKSEGKVKKFPDMKAIERRQSYGKMGARVATASKVTMLKETSAAIMAIARSRDTFRASDVSGELHLNDSFVRRVLRELEAQGKIEVAKKLPRGTKVWRIVRE